MQNQSEAIKLTYWPAPGNSDMPRVVVHFAAFAEASACRAVTVEGRFPRKPGAARRNFAKAGHLQPGSTKGSQTMPVEAEGQRLAGRPVAARTRVIREEPIFGIPADCAAGQSGDLCALRQGGRAPSDFVSGVWRSGRANVGGPGGLHWFCRAHF
jgi:hypothetical protein